MVSEAGTRRLSRAEQQARTRKRLLEVGATLFAKKGYSATGLDEIAEHAGLTKGAVYSNFSSKADLALAVLDELELSPRLDIFSRVDSGTSFPDQHEQGGKLLAEAMDASSLWFQLELQCILQAERDPELHRRMHERDLALRSSLAAAIAKRMELAGWAPTSDVGIIVDALIAVSSGLALQRLKDPSFVTDDLVGRLIAAVYESFASDVRRPSPATSTTSRKRRTS